MDKDRAIIILQEIAARLRRGDITYSDNIVKTQEQRRRSSNITAADLQMIAEMLKESND